MYNKIIKSGIETNTYLHINSSHKGVVCVKVCVGFSARLFCVLMPIRFKKGGPITLTEIIFLPNNIFDEYIKPRDFAVYSFPVSRKDRNDGIDNSVPLSQILVINNIIIQ